MNKEMIDFVISQGIFAVFFGYLLLYVLRENSSREDRYQQLLKELTTFLPEIKRDISSIKCSLKNK